MKKIIAVILALTLMMGAFSFAYADGTSARLYNVYGDGMLFAQNKEAILAGVAECGTEITAELYSDGEICASGKSVVTEQGTFEVSFIAPEGGYKEYTVKMKENGIEFDSLEGVVFGELWLASGQSNMQYPLAQAKGGRDLFAKGEKLSKWIRTLYMPSYPGNTAGPEITYRDPQIEIKDAYWFSGENLSFYNISAVAYYFAADLQEKLDMPIGILNASLGGSSIASWLSREAIDSDETVKNDFVSRGMYIERNKWDEQGQNVYADMTANYNHKIEPLRHFRPSGLIWYQGESDIFWTDKAYSDAYDLMQRSYSKLFGYEESLMPFICTQLAAYIYSDDRFELPDRNICFSQMQAQRPESRAAVAIYDVPLTWIPEAGAIHPECKREIGEKMAFAADGLVYGIEISYTAPSVSSTEIRDGSVYVTMKDVGDGLASKGDKLYGFAVCGEDGIYVQAGAEIVNANTVRVWSDGVASPVAATYAYSLNNMRSNLYATAEGELTLNASPFVTKRIDGAHYWIDRQWTDCENEFTWHVTDDDKFKGEYSSWSSDGANISYGNGYMNVSGEDAFSISPVMTYKDGAFEKVFEDADKDYSDYGKMTVEIRNNGKNDISLDCVRIYKNALMWYSPAVNGEKSTETVIPADGKWYKITFDLNRLYLYGNEGGASRPCGRLDNVKEIRFDFGAGEVSIDNIRFLPDTENCGVRFDPEFSNADSVLEKISALFISTIGKIISLFA